MNYISRMKPFAHQRKALEKARPHKAFAFRMAMRCVDSETEYLSPIGWRKISNYQGGKVAEFRLDGTAHFVDPIEYIKAPADRMWHFKTQGGIDQVLSENHRMLVCAFEKATYGKFVGSVPVDFRSLERRSTGAWRETTPAELIAKKKYEKPMCPTSFWMENETAINMSEAELRLMVAFHADGSFGTRDLSNITSKRNGVIRIKKAVKKKRLRELLNAWGGDWKEKKTKDHFSCFIFKPPRVSKTYGEEWWSASWDQKAIITDEVWRWDGRIKKKRSGAINYSSIHQGDVDFIQYCFCSIGKRASSRKNEDGTIGLCVSGNGRTNNLAHFRKPKPFTKHDGFMYSFQVPSSYLVFRRNGKVFVSGNTGKTKVLLDRFGELELKRLADDLLVIAPGGVYRTWEKAIQEHVGDHLLHRLDVFTCVSGGGARQELRIRQFLANRNQPRVLLINVEALSTVKRARELVIEFLRQRRSVAAIDESTIIKNHDAERTKFICNQLAPLATYRFILTGLIAPRSPLDIYFQFYFLDPKILGFSSYYAFRARYAIMKKMELANGRKFPIVVNYRDVDELYDRIEPRSFRIKLEDCYDMPPAVYMRRDVELTDEQWKAYQEMKLFATTEISKHRHVTATIVITQMLRLQQILCGHIKDEDGKVHLIPEKRTKALLELLEEYDGKAIIWCSYDLDIQKIAAALDKEYGKGSAAKFWGGNRSEREREEARFLQDNACRFMVATPAAGGRGRTWPIANLVVYYSCNNDLEQRAQSEERPKAVGKKTPIAYVDLIAPGTVNETIIKALRKKIDLAAIIDGDNWKSWLI